jgi:hypothetical protein
MFLVAWHRKWSVLLPRQESDSTRSVPAAFAAAAGKSAVFSAAAEKMDVFAAAAGVRHHRVSFPATFPAAAAEMDGLLPRQERDSTEARSPVFPATAAEKDGFAAAVGA